MSKEIIEMQLRSKVVYEGALLKRSKFLKEWRQRWVVLTSSFLITFMSRTCREITEVIHLSNVKYIKSYLNHQEEMEPTGFKIRSDEEELYLSAKDIHQKWNWIVVIERLMDYRNTSNNDGNDLKYATETGFPSSQEYLGIVKKKEVIDRKVIKKQIELESIEMMKDIIQKQEEVRCEKENLNKQKEEMVTLKEKCKALHAQVYELIVSNGELKRTLQVKKIPEQDNSSSLLQKDELIQLNSKIRRFRVMQCLLEELVECQSAKTDLLMIFMMNTIAEKFHGYLQAFIMCLKTNKGNFKFIEMLLQRIQKEDFLNRNLDTVTGFLLVVMQNYANVLSVDQMQVLRQKLREVVQTHNPQNVDKTYSLINLLQKISINTRQAVKRSFKSSIVHIDSSSSTHNARKINHQ